MSSLPFRTWVSPDCAAVRNPAVQIEEANTKSALSFMSQLTHRGTNHCHDKKGRDSFSTQIDITLFSIVRLIWMSFSHISVPILNYLPCLHWKTDHYQCYSAANLKISSCHLAAADSSAQAVKAFQKQRCADLLLCMSTYWPSGRGSVASVLKMSSYHTASVQATNFIFLKGGRRQG